MYLNQFSPKNVHVCQTETKPGSKISASDDFSMLNFRRNYIRNSCISRNWCFNAENVQRFAYHLALILLSLRMLEHSGYGFDISPYPISFRHIFWWSSILNIENIATATYFRRILIKFNSNHLKLTADNGWFVE